MKTNPNFRRFAWGQSTGGSTRGRALGAFLLLALLAAPTSWSATVSNYTATGWVTGLLNMGTVVTNAQGQVYSRGNVHTARVLSDDPRLTGIRTVLVNGDYDATGTAILWGAVYHQVGTFDAQNNFTPTGEFWDVIYRGTMPPDNSLDVLLSGHGSAGRIEGMRLQEHMVRAAGAILDPSIPYQYTGTLQAAPVDAVAILDNFDDNRFTGSTWEMGACSLAEANQQFTLRARATSPVSSIADAYLIAGYEDRNVAIPNGLTREWRADLVQLSGGATNVSLMTAGTLSGFYAFHKSADCAFLLKWINGNTILFAADSVPMRNTNVILSLAILNLEPNLVVTARVLDKSNPSTVLYERTVIDTPSIDASINTAQFQAITGMRLTDLSSDVAGKALSSFGSSLGVWQYSDGSQGQAEATFDNLEVRTYEVPKVSVERAVRLTFPWRANAGYVVEAAPSVLGPFVPLSLPEMPGLQQVTVPATEDLKFFRVR